MLVGLSEGRDGVLVKFRAGTGLLIVPWEWDW